MKRFIWNTSEPGRFACCLGATALAFALAPIDTATAQDVREGTSVFMGDGNGTSIAVDANALLERAQEMGEIMIIVEVDASFAPEGTLGAAAVANQRSGIAAAQSTLMGALENPSNVYRFETIPFMAMTVSPTDLSRVFSAPGVVSIGEDVADHPNLDDSVPLIEVDQIWKRGHKGNGAVVAVLDTGTRPNHVAFRDPDGIKIVGSACFSTKSSKAKSLCPNGKSKQVHNKNGSAAPDCNHRISGCGHGTHVASIAAGFQRGNHGVAQRSDILSVQVFRKFNSKFDCGEIPAPCVKSSASDQAKGLRKVLKWVEQGRDVAAVNMSLGGGKYASHCDNGSAANRMRKAVIDNLRSAGVPTIISSGNNRYDGFVNAPACISTAVAVGNTTKRDDIWRTSNHSDVVDLLAPGTSIRAASLVGPRNKLIARTGTSMAAPHVAGAFALLKDAVPNATLEEIEQALKCTGKRITRNGISKPRISVKAAFDYLKTPVIQRTRTFNFESSAEVDEWTDVVGNWRHKGNQMHVVADIPDNSISNYFTQIPFAPVTPLVWLCADDDFRITALVKHIDPEDTGAGLFVGTGASDDLVVSGFFFSYHAAEGIPDNVFGAQYVEGYHLKTGRFDGGGPTTCTFRIEGKPIVQRTMIIEKRGFTLFFKIGSKTVCTLQTDFDFAASHAGVWMEGTTPKPQHYMDVYKVKLQTFNRRAR